MRQIEARELHARREAGESIVLLDVREHDEVNYCKISDSLHIPMNQVPMRMHELDPQSTVVVYCHKGGRSMQVCRFLEARGFKDVFNLQGGITQWSQQVDPTVPQY